MKVANSYKSVLRGVSQQVAHSRAPGQHAEQVNLLSDPVRGLVRRHGSVFKAQMATAGTPSFSYGGSATAQQDADTASWGTSSFSYGGNDYVVLFRKAAYAGPLPPVVLYNSTSGSFVPTQAAPGDAGAATLAAAGISALTGIGRYLLMAGNGVQVTGSSEDLWRSTSNTAASVVWVRGGAYSRAFSVTAVKRNGTRVSVTRITPSASYQGVLTTSDIAATDPAYTKKVNDRVNDYNSAVTAWIGAASAASQPAAIASALAAMLNAGGATCSVIGSHICFSAAADVVKVETDDGGDGTLLRGVADEVTSPDRLSVVHKHGKVVKVTPADSAEAYYMKAVKKDTGLTADYQEVTWVEGAGAITGISGGLFFGTIHAGVFYYASSASSLASATWLAVPDFIPSTVGDVDSSPAPYFVGKEITYLGVFQDRLLVGSGGVVSASRTGDYLNFFRSTVLTVPADDPFDITPQAGEYDVLRHSVLYDRDLVLFGDRRQYVLSGSVPLSPTSVAMPVFSAFEDVTSVRPIAVGGFIFYAKRGAAASSVHQMQPIANSTSPESFPVSSQLEDYIAGGITSMASVTGQPSLLLCTATGRRDSVFVFSYLDRQDGRKLDSWSRWVFNQSLGSVLAVSAYRDKVVVFFTRLVGGVLHFVADEVSIAAATAAAPYLDSMRSYEDSSVSDGLTHVAYDTSGPFLRGAAYSSAATLQAASGATGLVAGALSPAYVTLTNPNMLDRDGRTILSGRLTITKLSVSFENSTGFRWAVTADGAATEDGEFSGRLLGGTDLIGVEPVVTGAFSVPVGRETRSYTLTLSARDWHPLAVTAIEWVGQFFNRAQRF